MIPNYIDLKDLGADKVELEGAFEPGVLDFSGESVRQIGPLAWTATAERAGAEIRISGKLETAVELPCSRCLELAVCPVSRSFDLFFRQSDDDLYDEDEIELSEKDTRTAFFDGTRLAIGDVLREQVLLALPMKALCRVDCKGLCPTCGTNLNSTHCACVKEQFNPHLDSLLELKRRLEERSS